MNSLYDRLGKSNLISLVDTFYNLVFEDSRIAHLFKSDIYLIKEKQTKFLTQFLGGPPLYTESYGHPKMRMRHLPHKIDKIAALAWLENMSKRC